VPAETFGSVKRRRHCSYGGVGLNPSVLEMLCLKLELDGVSLIPKKKKPFDLAVEGL
jgi:hypothetical protein